MKIGNLIQRDLQNAADLTGDDEPTRMGRVDGNGGDRYSGVDRATPAGSRREHVDLPGGGRDDQVLPAVENGEVVDEAG